MFYLLEVDGFAGEVLQIVHDYLFSVRHEHRNSVVFRILFQAPLRLLDLHLDVLEAGQINLIQDFLLDLLKVLFLKLNLIRDRNDFFLKAINFFLVNRNMLYLVSHWPVLVIGYLLLPIFDMVLGFGLVNGLLYSLLEI